ncbi:putative alpha/beta superfamily hydrolase [Corynespora cassiicola Philippines]|uniref:Putative alpha/beta superfamily hydrolase n=1 Tax=Corynespora cassiicola Philippines TaxID=1448308 RepID=A0A2T2NMK7_CORCC|nr:putative alpha/beta superfamily hydrolase [Corynespora cassiicola Philippines]
MGIFTTSVKAQNLSFGADNFYTSDLVDLKPITFPNLFGHTIAANLITPKNMTGNLSAIVVSHPAGAVKEQSANLYATKLAEQGFVTIALDHAFFGSSEGTPRNSVVPDLLAESFSAAVDYLGLQDYVNRERIGGVGICGSGSYIISAAKIDPRLKAIATSSMYDMGDSYRNGIENGVSTEQRKATIAAAAEQRWVEAAGGATQYNLGTPLVLTNASTDIDREFYDYYRTSRGAYTPSGGSFNITTGSAATSHIKLANFYPFQNIEDISPRPLLFITGDRAHSREFSEKAYAQAAEPKELMWIPNAGHVDLYDRVDLIPFDRLTEFFRTNLNA